MNDLSRRAFLRTSSMTAVGLGLRRFTFAQQRSDYRYLSIAEVSKLVRNQMVSPVELTRACLKKIEELNPRLNAFITVTGDSALRESELAEREIRNGRWKGPLHGIPIAYKDNIDTAGVRTTAASGVYEDRVPTEDAEVVTRLREAGAISLGKQNMHEFALGTTSVVSHFGSVHNPWNVDYITGGSSGGSAAAVAAGLCYASIGTDTGGSSRLPPACCGVTGFKATYGMISTRGIVPVIASVDHACPIGRSVEDIAILLNALANRDLTPECAIDYVKSFGNIEHPRIGVVQNFAASDEVRNNFEDAVNTFRSLGYTITGVELPAMPASSIVADAEIEAYHRPLISQWKDRYDPITLNDIGNAKNIASADYINEIVKMNEARNAISGVLFKDCDVIILPTATTATPTIKYATENGPFALDPHNTEPFNDYGLPAMSVPSGFCGNRLPLGLQIVGPRLGERQVLDIANRYQRATTWNLLHPDIS